MLPNPCFHCPERNSECHSDCKEYEDWKSDHNAGKSAMRAAIDYTEYQIHKTAKARKRNKGFIQQGGMLK